MNKSWSSLQKEIKKFLVQNKNNSFVLNAKRFKVNSYITFGNNNRYMLNEYTLNYDYVNQYEFDCIEDLIERIKDDYVNEKLCRVVDKNS